MGFRNISAWSIRNPVPSIVLFMMLTVAGIIAFIRMDINQEPDIEFPAVTISISQPGAAPSELETQVTQRVESAVRSLEGVDEIQSFVSEGNSTTFVQLDIGTPVDRAVNEARDAVTQIRADLPEGILEPQVQRVKINDNDLGSYTAVATDMTLEQLSWYIDNTVAKELLSVPGMGSVERIGGVNREIRVILDPAKVAAYGLTASQINQQLRQVNLNAAGGRAEIAGAEQAVRVLGNAQTAYDLGQTQISVGAGRTIRLTDVATVRDLYAEQRSAAAVDGRPALSFDFKRAKGASDVTVFREAKAKLEALEKRNPQVTFRLRVDGSKYALEQYKSAIHAMLEGAILAVVVVFLFLRDWRATVISALAIPLSAIPAFWFMDLMGFTLNSMTLLALSLVAGVLVDDAIVEIENIVRHMRMGKTAYQASIDAADEIGLAVLATTMAIVAVFLPVGLMPGVSGQFFKNFGLTVVVAVLMSLAVARLITPMIAAYFLKAFGHAEHGGGRLMDAYHRILLWTLDEGRAPLIRARGGFRRVTGYLRDHRAWVMAMGAGAFALTAFLFTQIPMTFQPAVDQPRSVVTITMPPGATLSTTQTAVDRVYALLDKEPAVESLYTRTLVGTGRVVATYKEDRAEKSTAFERRLAPELAKIPDARVNFQSQFGFGDNNRDISVTLGGDDPVVLRQTADRLVQEMARLPMLVAPRVAGDLNRPEILIKPRLDLAAQLGVTTSALSNAIRIATLGDLDQNSARFSLSDRQVPIRVALAENARTRLDTIQNLPVATQTGGSVPLSLVADIGFGSGPTRITRINQQRQLTVGSDLAPGLVTSEAMKRIKQLPVMQNLPVGVQELNVGQAKWQLEMLINFVFAVMAGVFLVFSVLVLLYRRLLPPLVNMGSLLLAPLGGLLAIMIAGMPLSMPVFIGLLMLLGIVAKNSILLIDFALDEMATGVAPRAAIIEAGHKRAQPIVMTTVAMVAGMIPTALSLSGDGAWRAPMGVVVIGGLILSTLLTLLIVPASFSLAIGVERRLGPWLGRRLLTYRPGDDGAPAIDHDAPKGSIAAPVGRIGFRDEPAE
ncbi:efflux RND transporter permease subunit [Sphingomonas corticis]|jgi:multidrug efflux pump subunit AcrB|uniref:Efflux RND transporter permease subunit n=1 Tax=Sphingomonas corticis TaxID=2722791 RepID=A0ABX1CW32_9SPHN|nr:efflux RND transporter permease subunit [Sphingomonas corticis]NJR80180.1 efflux RND transporter permease subunit [Sphingomonas corticis]